MPYSITVMRGYYTSTHVYDYTNNADGAAFADPADGVKEPLACPVGSYQPYDGQTTCLWCPAGFVCDTEATSDVLTACPKGQYCVEGTSEPASCPIGSYNDVFHKISADDCKSCPAGKYCNIEQGVEPTGDCEQGFFCVDGASTATPDTETFDSNGYPVYGPCPAGYYCPVGTVWPLPCPIGTYSASVEATSDETCISCPSGYFCDHEAMSFDPTGDTNYECDAGWYCPGGDKSARPYD